MSSRETSSTPNGQLRRRAYTFAVGMLAVFLVGLIVWPHPFHGYEATAILSARTASGEPMPTGAGTGSPLALNDQEILKMVGERSFVEAALAPRRDAPEHTLTDAELARVRNGLRVAHLTHEPDQARIAITCLQANDKDAQGVTQLLAGEVVRRWSHVDEKNLTLAEHRRRQYAVREARHYEKLARQAIDTFMNEHLQTSRRKAKTLLTNQPTFDPPEDATESTETQAEEPLPNPRWSELSGDLQKLYRERSELLARLTPKHPVVQDVIVEIARLEQEIEDTPKFLNEMRDPTQPVPELTASGSSYDAEVVQEVLGMFNNKLMETYTSLRTAYDTAEQQRQVAESALDDATTKLTAHTTPTFHWQIEPQAESQMMGGRPSAAIVAVMFLIGAIGGGVLVYLRETAAPLLFRSLKEVEESLSVPVVAEFSTGEVVRLTDASTLRSRGPKFAVTICEIILVVFGLVLLTATLFGSSLLWELSNDPLGTITQLFQNLV